MLEWNDKPLGLTARDGSSGELESLINEIDKAKTVEEIKEPLKICLRHVYSKHYTSCLDEPRY